MSRRDNGEHRCVRCRMLGGLCVCALLPDPPLRTRTRLVLFMHRDEERKTTNTGRLACQCIAGSDIRVRGNQHQPSAPFVAPPGTRPLLLFPYDDAAPLDRLPPSPDPFTLIVPDGTWRQARRVRARVPGLDSVPCVRLPAGEPSAYGLRTEHRPDGLATMEAIARAFELLEGPHVRAALDRVFLAMVERTLWSRGTIDAAAITSGRPEGALRHDPRRR
jgi:DTW domain-containing protein YfiP